MSNFIQYRKCVDSREWDVLQEHECELQEHECELQEHECELQEHGGVSNRLRFDSVRGEARFPPNNLI